MKKTPAFLFLFFLFAFPCAGQNDLKAQLEKLKSIFIASYINENAEERMKYYAPDAVSMPEYQPVIKGINAIKEYYIEIFKRQQIRAYQKEIVEIADLKEIVMETGIFTIDYTPAVGTSPVTHTGKYMNVWKVQKDGSLQLHAEAWGYFRHIEDPAVFYVNIENMGSDSPQGPETNISFELKALNALMENAVRSRNGRFQAEFYTEDGIYMPFADTMKVNKENIRQHLIGYTSGGNVMFDSISVYTDEFIPLDGYVIEYSRFFVKVRASGTLHIVKGKGIRLWKRMPDCSLKLHRQLGMHDFIE
jgi:ketosteroid isomerase-like protein